MKFEVYGMTKVGHLVHLIRADEMADAKAKFMRAHPKGSVSAVAVPNGMSDPVFLFGDSDSAQIQTKADIADLAKKLVAA